VLIEKVEDAWPFTEGDRELLALSLLVKSFIKYLVIVVEPPLVFVKQT